VPRLAPITLGRRLTPWPTAARSLFDPGIPEIRARRSRLGTNLGRDKVSQVDRPYAFKNRESIGSFR
jgi:hypothetical protein